MLQGMKAATQAKEKKFFFLIRSPHVALKKERQPLAVHRCHVGLSGCR